MSVSSPARLTDARNHQDPSWSAQIDRQARGRIQRTGQTSATTVYRLIVKGTADEVLLKIADDKGTALIAFTGEQGEVLCMLP